MALEARRCAPFATRLARRDRVLAARIAKAHAGRVLAGCASMSAMSHAERRHEVLVLGGGAAGLAAARTLVAEGVDVAVLEARGRFGGRVATVRAEDDEPIELGAEFVHGRAPRTTAIAEESDLELRGHATAQRWLRDGALVEAPDLA